jgi:cytochrome c556
MRTVHWLFAVSVALFIAGIGFIIAAGRMQQTATVTAAPAPAAAAKPVATVKQIMAGIVAPASNAVFNAVSTTVTEKGVEEVAPKNDEEWTALGNQAAVLAEAGNLIMVEGRAIDTGDWFKMSRAMVDAGQQTLKAVASKSPDAVLAAGEAVNQSCDTCHQRYTRQ